MFIKRKTKKITESESIQSSKEEVKVEIVSENNCDELKTTLKEVNNLLKYITELDYVKDMLLDVNKQAEMVENIAGGSEEFTATADDISNYVQESYDTTKSSIEVATTSIADIDDSFKQMEISFEESGKVQEIMTRVNEEAKKINDLVAIIKGVADQTNLLALNASIEAARAGEHGRGFAVVADEIKKLAENTKEQVAFINNIVGSLTGEINNTGHALEQARTSFEKGKEKMDNAIVSLDNMRSGLDTIGESFMNITANIEEQTAASEEMSSSIMVVNEKTKVLRTETNRTGDAINTVSHLVNKIRLGLLDKAGDLEMQDQIEICISDHLIWRWKVYNMILGYENLSEDQVGTHHTCRLGKWCDNTSFEESQICAAIERMEKPHRELHEYAKEAISQYNRGDIAGAERTLSKLDACSKDVVACLLEIKSIS